MPFKHLWRWLARIRGRSPPVPAIPAPTEARSRGCLTFSLRSVGSSSDVILDPPITTGVLQRALARRTEIVLSGEDNLREAMKQVEEAAYSGGLVSEATHLEWKHAEEFSQQLWVENPAALDWLNLKRENMKDPAEIQDLPDLLDVLGS